MRKLTSRILMCSLTRFLTSFFTRFFTYFFTCFCKRVCMCVCICVCIGACVCALMCLPMATLTANAAISPNQQRPAADANDAHFGSNDDARSSFDDDVHSNAEDDHVHADSDVAGTSESSDKSSSCLYENQETGYLVILEDDAELLTEEEEKQLSLEMQGITAYGSVIFKSVSYNSSSASYFARNYYHEKLGSGSGTLFLIDMDNREIYIFSDGAVYDTITTAYANTITDNVYRYASDQNYYLCASTAFQQIGTLLSGHRIAQPMKYISNALLALILAALFNYFIARASSKTAKASDREILDSIPTGFSFTNPYKVMTSKTKTYDPVRSSGGSGGGSSSGGGGSSSGGGGGHRF